MLLKNVASQGVYLYAVDTTTPPYGPKTGDASNITGSVSLDGGARAAIGSGSHPAEIDSANMPGVYWHSLAQGETNGNRVAFAWKSTTSGIFITPVFVETSGVNLPAVAYNGAAGLPVIGSAPFPASGTIAASVCDEVNTGATHNVNNSLGKQIRLINPNSDVIYSSILPSQSGVTTTQVKLDTGASAVDNAYQYNEFSVISGTGQGSRVCLSYVGATRLATVDSVWAVAPVAGDVVEVTPTANVRVVSYATGQDPATLTWAATTRTLTAFGFSVTLAASQHVIVDSGTVTTLTNLPAIPNNWITAAGIAANALNGKGDWLLASSYSTADIATAVLNAFCVASDAVAASPSPTSSAFAGSSGLSSVNDFYKGSVLFFTSGVLDGIARKITGYTGATRLFAFFAPFPDVPTAGDTFRILGRID